MCLGDKSLSFAWIEVQGMCEDLRRVGRAIEGLFITSTL